MNENIICVILAYLIGGVPFGLILGKFFGGVDIRAFGSHSIGATNVLRVIKEKDPKKGKILAIATALCDIFKGVIPILIARAFDVSLNTQWSMAVFAVLGHCFSPYLVFKGGKGVATAAGVLACFVPAEVAIAVVGWFVCGKMLKISSLASLAAVLCFAVALYFIHPQMQGINTYAPIVVIIFTIIYKHIPNIVRLIKGDEKKVI